MVWMEFENAEYSMSSKDLTLFLIYQMVDKWCYIAETKIQKLLYMIYWLYLFEKQKTIINDEKPHARPYWPVFPKIRKIFKDRSYAIQMSHKYPIENIKDDSLKTIIEKVVDKFWNCSSSQLVEWSHMNNSPRTQTKNSPFFDWNDRIEDELTYNYFNELSK